MACKEIILFWVNGTSSSDDDDGFGGKNNVKQTNDTIYNAMLMQAL